MTIQDVSVLKALQLNKASGDRQAKQPDMKHVCADYCWCPQIRFTNMIV